LPFLLWRHKAPELKGEPFGGALFSAIDLRHMRAINDRPYSAIRLLGVIPQKSVGKGDKNNRRIVGAIIDHPPVGCFNGWLSPAISLSANSSFV
jgi:hypothetical protein